MTDSEVLLDISQIGPQLLGHRLEVVDVNGNRAGLYLVFYEVLPDVDGDILYKLYNPFRVTVNVRPGAKLRIVDAPATAPKPLPTVNGTAPRPPADDVPAAQ